jgi:hypothetical protein
LYSELARGHFSEPNCSVRVLTTFSVSLCAPEMGSLNTGEWRASYLLTLAHCGMHEWKTDRGSSYLWAHIGLPLRKGWRIDTIKTG